MKIKRSRPNFTGILPELVRPTLALGGGGGQSAPPPAHVSYGYDNIPVYSPEKEWNKILKEFFFYGRRELLKIFKARSLRSLA